jgi:parvulin-like peptidyl-prolyl isomerase
MDSLRNFLTGPRLFIVIAACALPFVFLGTSSLGTVFDQGSVGTINGENVSENDYNFAATNAERKLKRIYGDDFKLDLLDEETAISLIQQELIVQKVFLSQARSFGLINKTTTKLAKEGIQENPQFMIDGTFSEGVYEAQVTSAGHTKQSYIDSTRDLLATEGYRQSVASLNFSTDEEIKELASLLEQTVDINFIKIDSAALKKNVVNTETELEDFYSTNQIMFYSDEARSFNYFLLTPEAYKDKVEVPEGYIETAYSDYLSKASERTQIRIAHIMIEKSNYDSDQIAFETLKDIETKISTGEDFSILANTYSDDVVTKENGGDLEYFSNDVFPEEFGEAIKGLKLNDTSSIIELDDTLHILKITEYNEAEILSIEDMSSDMISQLVNAESLALMNDDFDLLDQMIVQNDDIENIASSIGQEILASNKYTSQDFDFDIKDSRIQDYVFSPDAEIGSTFAIDLDESILVLSLKDVEESSLLEYSSVRAEVNTLLSSDKANTKQELLNKEIEVVRKNGDIEEFISAYEFISKDSFVDVKRYSSLIPQEISQELFKLQSGQSISMNANNGDTYIIDLTMIKKPSEESLTELLEQYKSFSEQRIFEKMNDIIQSQIIDNARVNLNEQI